MNTIELYRLFRLSSGVSIDSRTVSDNQLFFAIKGDNFDGNKFAQDALKKGASYVVLDDPGAVTDRCMLVGNTLQELQSLASFYRNNLNAKVLAITGTNGKTTTKELITAVLSKKYKVHSTKGNLNNQIGVPLTILSAPIDTDILVVEMGASHPGDIEELCEIAQPDFGLITNIGTAHLAGFGSLDGVISTKTELYRYLKGKFGTAFFNDKDQLLTEQIKLSKVGATPLSSVNGTPLDIKRVSESYYLQLIVEYGVDSKMLNTKLFGKYNIDNIKTAVSIGLAFGVGFNDIIDAIQCYEPSNNRSQIRKTDSNTLVCDAYNANPVSMTKAIEAFAEIPEPNKLCILGDMLELGSASTGEHKAIIGLLREKGFKSVLLVGPEFSKVAPPDYPSFQNIGEAIKHIGINCPINSLILLKGSRGISLEKLYPLL